MSSISLSDKDTLSSVSSDRYLAHIKSSLKPNIWCKGCKQHNLMFIQYFPLDQFKTLTCTECCHSRISNDPQPDQLARINSSSKQVFTSSENPGNPGEGNEQKYVADLMKLMKASKNAANAANHTNRPKKQAKQKNINNTNLQKINGNPPTSFAGKILSLTLRLILRIFKISKERNLSRVLMVQ